MDFIISNLLNLSFQSFVTASLAYIVPVVLLIVTICFIRMDCRVKCWFCNYYTCVPRSQSNSWYCPACEQYNGFNKDGDYNKCIPAQRRPEFNAPCSFTNKRADFCMESDILCNICTQRQRVKMQLINQFDTADEANWECQFRSYQNKLEQKYALCSLCESLAQQRVRQCDTLVLPKYVEWTKQQAQKAFFRKMSTLYKWNWRRSFLSGLVLMTLYTNFVASSLFVMVNSRHSTTLTKFLQKYFHYIDCDSMLLMNLVSSMLHLMLNVFLKCLNRCIIINILLTIVFLSISQLKLHVHLAVSISLQILHIACSVLALSFKVPASSYITRRRSGSVPPPPDVDNSIQSRPSSTPQQNEQQNRFDNFSDTASVFSTSSGRFGNPFYLHGNDNFGNAPSIASSRLHPRSPHSVISAPKFQYNRPNSVASFPHHSALTRSNSNNDFYNNHLNGDHFDIPSPPPSRCSSPLSTMNGDSASAYSRSCHVSPRQCNLLNESPKSQCCDGSESEEPDDPNQSRQCTAPLLVRLLCGILLGIGFTCVIQLAILPGLGLAKKHFLVILRKLNQRN